MGCDIHAYLEIRQAPNSNRWTCFCQFYLGRDYDCFSILNGVRDYFKVSPTLAPKYRGLPDNLSFTVQCEYDSDEPDAHSTSWLTPDEFHEYPAWNTPFPDSRDNNNLITPKELWNEEFQAVFDAMDTLSKYYGKDNVRFVFWYDN